MGESDTTGAETFPEGSLAGHLVWRLSLKWRTAVDRAVAPLGLTQATYSFVASLYAMQREGRQPNQRELAERTGLEALYVSKLARALEADGLIARVRDSADTRAVRLTLTERGEQAAREAITVVQARLDTLLAPLGGTSGDAAAAFVEELRTLLAA
ncbi:DNA-binding MarR family transcriptional regulator [Streptacidiphilus sp. MAP12-33]|uniref:MarR family winged helix-turn-helix transcriptional regulator n=1 Tax=Streptacidiphilus sp. MAP12-33 TaxID=3156266 RepID=UPI003512A4B9